MLVGVGVLVGMGVSVGVGVLVLVGVLVAVLDGLAVLVLDGEGEGVSVALAVAVLDGSVVGVLEGSVVGVGLFVLGLTPFSTTGDVRGVKIFVTTQHSVRSTTTAEIILFRLFFFIMLKIQLHMRLAYVISPFTNSCLFISSPYQYDEESDLP